MENWEMIPVFCHFLEIKKVLTSTARCGSHNERYIARKIVRQIFQEKGSTFVEIWDFLKLEGHARVCVSNATRLAKWQNRKNIHSLLQSYPQVAVDKIVDNFLLTL